jgi:cystathionine beta-lyase/cystathionine gamma-synthase
MGALFSAVIAHLRSGDHIVAQAGLYGGTQTLLTDGLSRLGITCSFAPAATGEDFEEALRAAEAGGHRPRAMLVETVANPSLAVAELPALSRLAARRGLLFIVDNTYPARTSHRSLSAREREAAGACAGLVRLSVGTEDTRDILEDLDHALG